jgi:hypothetical protein
MCHALSSSTHLRQEDDGCHGHDVQNGLVEDKHRAADGHVRHLRFNQADPTDIQKLCFPGFRGKNSRARISTILRRKEDDGEGRRGDTMRKPMKLADADILAA